MSLLGDGPPAFMGWEFYRDALYMSTALFVASLLLGLAVMILVPGVLRLLVRPDKVYRLYGIGYWAHRTTGRMSNSKFFTQLFGDSSSIVGYLQAIGYDLGRVEQTGSNFGTAVAHDNPFLSSVGGGTVVADGLTFVNADYSNTSFRVSRVSIGGAQLPRQRHRLSGAGSDRGRLPARDEGHGPGGRPDPRRGGSARLAQLRDPADDRTGQDAGPERGRSAPRAGRQEPAQRGHPSRCSCCHGGCSSRSSPWSH